MCQLRLKFLRIWECQIPKIKTRVSSFFFRFFVLFKKKFSGFSFSTGQSLIVNTRQTHKAIDSESLRGLTFAATASCLKLSYAAAAAARFRAVASRIRLRKRNDLGVASTYSSESMYLMARSRLMRSGASS